MSTSTETSLTGAKLQVANVVEASCVDCLVDPLPEEPEPIDIFPYTNALMET